MGEIYPSGSESVSDEISESLSYCCLGHAPSSGGAMGVVEGGGEDSKTDSDAIVGAEFDRDSEISSDSESSESNEISESDAINPVK